MKARHKQLMETVGSNIRGIMVKRKRDMGDLGKVLGIKPQQIQTILTAQAVLTFPDAVKLAKYLKCDLDKFLETD